MFRSYRNQSLMRTMGVKELNKFYETLITFLRHYKFVWKILDQFFFNPFHANGPFLYPLKTLENLWFYDVFRGYRNDEILTWNELIPILFAEFMNDFFVGFGTVQQHMLLPKKLMPECWSTYQQNITLFTRGPTIWYFLLPLYFSRPRRITESIELLTEKA